MMKLQQLCGLMEEETYIDEEHILREGEVGDKFYITVAGTVSLKYTLATWKRQYFR